MVLDERQALELAIGQLQEGEVVALFYDKLEQVLEVLVHHSAAPVMTFDEMSLAGAPRSATAVGVNARPAKMHLLEQSERVYAAGENA